MEEADWRWMSDDGMRCRVLMSDVWIMLSGWCSVWERGAFGVIKVHVFSLEGSHVLACLSYA